MQDWYSEGFFPPDLPIKHVEDPGFVSIGALVSRFGSKAPFLAELEESHAMSRLLYERRVAAMVMSSQQQDALRFGTGYAGTSAVSNVIKADNSSSAWGIPSLNSVRPTWDENRHHEPAVNVVAPPQRPEINQSANVVSRPEVEIAQGKIPTSPLEKKLEGLQVSPVSQAAPTKTSKAVDPMALPPKPKPISPGSTDKKRGDKPIKSEEVSPIKAGTPMAPWAKAGSLSSSQASAPKVKMSEIQDKEEIRRHLLEQERQKKADEHVLAQAAAIMKAEAQSSKPSEGPVWGSKSSKPAALRFSDIMVQENLQKTSNVEYQGNPNVVLGGAKRYADLVNSPSTSHVIKAARPQTVPSSSQVKNVVASKEVISSGWHTVGKGGHVVQPPVESR